MDDPQDCYTEGCDPPERKWMTLRIETLRVMTLRGDCDTQGHDPQGQGWMTLRIDILRVVTLKDGDG